MTRILGGLTVLGGGAVLVALVGLGWATMRVVNLRNTQAYSVSVEFLKKSPAVRAQVGDDAQINPLVWGDVDSRLDGTGTARLYHVITSSKGARIVTVELVKKDDMWAAKGASGDNDGKAFTVDAGPPTAQMPHDPAKSIEAVARGDEDYAKSDYVAAMAEYEQAVSLDPNNPAAWLGRGKANGRRGEAERAVADLEQAVELAPGSADAWEALSWARLHSGRDKQALEALNKLLELRPGDARALGMRADANSKLGDMPAAKADADLACRGGDSFACNLQQRLR